MTSERVPTVDHGALALGRRLGQGGQGTVHEVTNKKINETDGGGWEVAYKEYNAAVLPHLDAAALAASVALPGELSAAEGRWLCEKTAWPAALVERQGSASGFLMRTVPDRFRFTLQSLGGTTPGARRPANLEYLLNDDAYVAGIGLSVSERDRLLLLTDLAATLTRLHRIGITVGDLSPKNLLFTTGTPPECFLIDCDAMRLRGTGVLPQAETPDWQIPDGEEKATRASDVYKLALLAIRLFARDQTSRDPAALASVSPELSDLARAGLDPDPARRPLPAQWAATTASTAPAAAPAANGGKGASAPPRRRAGAPGPPGTPPGPPGGGPNWSAAKALVAAAAVILVIIVGVVGGHSGGGSGQASESSTQPSVSQDDGGGTSPYDDSSGGSGSTSLDPTPSDSPSESASPTPDPVGDAEVGSCFDDRGTGNHSDLTPTSCTSGAFKVVQINSATTDLNSCDGVTDSDRSVSSAEHDRVLCLSYLSPGGTAYHARSGDCVYGTSPSSSWSEVSCQTGNFKVLAAYRGTSDSAKCNSLTHYNQWLHIPAGGYSGLDMMLCLSMNYPDDAGYATQRECLLKSGDGPKARFTNVGSCASSNVYVTGRTSTYNDAGFCNQDGWTTWENPDYPRLGYTVCWRPR